MRGPSDVGCAHCTQLGATEACRVCKRLVCPDCHGKPMTCGEASGFETRLGVGARVRAIDPQGRLALVVHPLRRPRILDLRAARWVASLDSEALHPVLTADGLLLGLVQQAIDRETTLWTGVQARDVRTGKEAWVEHVNPLVRPELGISPGGTHVWYPTRPVHGGGYTIGVIRSPRAVTDYDLPYPYPIDAGALDGERERLAVVGGQRLAVYDLRGATFAELGASHLLPHHRPVWVGLAGDHVVSIVDVGDELIVTQHVLNTELLAVRTRRVPGPLAAAAIAIDGTHAAVAVGRALHLLDLRVGSGYAPDEIGAVMLGGHTDDISYLRFATDGVLISADDDNRVHLRRRVGSGYATELVPIEITS